MKVHIVADFNVEILKRFLREDGRKFLGPGAVQVESSPVNQGLPYLLGLANSGTFEDAVFILSFPETLFPEFQKAKRLEDIDEANLFDQLDRYLSVLTSVSKRTKLVMASPFMNAFNEPGYGILDWKPGLGLRYLLAKMNLRVAEQMADAQNFFLLEWPELGPNDQGRFSPKMWYAAKTPFSNAALKSFSREMLRALQAVLGQSRRLIILDLDQTLWGGVIGETGWAGIRLGGHDHVGEAFKDFQRALKALTRRGIQLAVVSKNDENVALEAFDNNPEMIIRREDLAGWRINWSDKAENVAGLLQEVNLGGASAVFIDDNPSERERVRMSLPEILVPEWPEDPSLYVQALWGLRCFDVPAITVEDRHRTQMYAAERNRKEAKLNVASIDGWLESIDTKVRVEPLSTLNLPRVAQLYNKTNQLNLSTRRLTEAEIMDWASQPGRAVWSISVSDKFGDLGLTGVLGLAVEGDLVRLVDYVLSCRAMGRMVEETMFHLAVDWARRLKAQRVVATYLPTERNRPTLDVLRKGQLAEESPNEFVWNCTDDYLKPKCINLEVSPSKE